MKKIMTLAILLMLTVPALAAEAGKHVFVTIDGLICDFCAVAMKKVFMKKDPVAEVEVNLTTKIVTIGLKPGKTLEDDDIKKGVTDAGYTVVRIERD